jgi:hypothetical protein
MRWWRGGARVEPEEGDDRWGPLVSRARRGVKAARGEAFPHEGGGNRAGRHQHVAGWAESEGGVGRDAESQWGEGERPVGEGKRKWAMAGPKTRAGPNSSNKTFLNFYLEFKFLATLEICTRRFRRNFDMRIFPKIFWAFLGFLEMKMNGM